MATGNQVVGNAIASGAIRAYRFVKVTSTAFTLAEANANERIAGVNEHHSVASGESFDYAIEGEVQIELGGTATAGNDVKSDAEGAAVELAGTGNENVGATLLQSGVAGDVVRAVIKRAEVDVS